jgi:2-haloacid dehalogenase
MVRGILFDAYGTLFDVYSIAALAEETFPGRGEALAALWRDKQLEYSRLRTLCDRYVDFLTVTEEALRHSCDRLQLVLSETACRCLLGQYLRLAAHPDVAPALQGLRRCGVPLGILSNGSPAMLDGAIVAAGLSGLFTHVLSADRVRRFKTAREVYDLGVEAFGGPAQELAFVSSNGWDACGATWYGYRTVWLNRTAAPAERLGVAPDVEARSMLDLTALLGLA